MDNKPFRISLQVDQRTCRAGHGLSGKVLVQFSKGLELTNDATASIRLQFLGTEHSNVSEQRNPYEYNRRIHHDDDNGEHSKYSTHVLAQTDCPFVNLGSSIEPGHYEYPFDIQLPDILPTSITCSDPSNGESFCKLEYTLTAYLSTSSVVPTIAVPEDEELKSTVVLSIQSAPLHLSHNEPLMIPPLDLPIESCCGLRKRGLVCLGLKVQHQVASPGQDIHVHCWVENQNNDKVPMERISVRLVETVTWRIGPTALLADQRSIKRILAEQNILAKADRSRNRGESKTSSCEKPRVDDKTSITFDLKLPKEARETYTGRLIQVFHLLVITVHTKGLLATCPQTACPIRIARSNAAGDATSSASEEKTPQLQHVLFPRPREAVLMKDPGNTDSDKKNIATFQSILTRDPETIPSLLQDDSDWDKVVRDYLSGSARNFGVLVTMAGPRDAPTVARALATCMNSSGNSRNASSDVSFQCRHLLACLWALPLPSRPIEPDGSIDCAKDDDDVDDRNNTIVNSRLAVLRELTPLATDLDQNAGMMEQELMANPQERQAFQQGIGKACVKSLALIASP